MARYEKKDLAEKVLSTAISAMKLKQREKGDSCISRKKKQKGKEERCKGIRENAEEYRGRRTSARGDPPGQELLPRWRGFLQKKKKKIKGG